MVDIKSVTNVTIRTGGQGIKGPPGEAEIHALKHSKDGVDEVTVENLATDATDTSKVLKPDGAGGTVFGNESGGGGTVGFGWNFNPASQVMDDPGSGIFKLNQVDQTTATQLAISDITDNGVDIGDALDNLRAGTFIYVEESDNNTRFRLYEVTATPTDNGTWHQVALSFNNGGGALTAVLCGFALARGTLAPHAPTHSAGGSDEITVEDLGSAGSAGEVLTADGAGNVSMQPNAGGNVSSPGGETDGRVAKFTGANAVDETATTETELATAVTHSGIVTGNPHVLDAADVGAEPAGSIATHTADADAHHAEAHTLESHTGVATTGAQLDAHIADVTGNPHAVTAVQAGAEPAGAIATHAALGDVHHAEVHTIVSHDTTTTGAQLTSLADGSDVDSLHDHGKFSLTDGSKAFTGTVGGITPVSGSDLSTKDYIDSAVQGIEWQDTVLDRDLATPPGSPATDDRYIVAAGGTGDWASHDDDITEWNGAAWIFTVPTVGMTVAVDDENRNLRWSGSSWVFFGTTVDHGNLAGNADDDHLLYLNRSGVRPMTGDLDLDGNDIQGGITLGGTLTDVGMVDYADEIGSVGFFGDPTGLIVANGDDFDVATGVGSFHTGATINSKLGIGDWPAASSQTIPLNSIRYVGAEWNAGTPQIVVKTTNVWTLIQEQPLGIVTRDADGVHPTVKPIRLSSFSSLIDQRISETDPFARANGMNLGNSSLTVQRTAGRGWLVTTPQDYALFDSGASDTFDRYFQLAGPGFDVELNETSFEDQSFENGSGTLGVLTNNRFGVRWFYMDLQTGGLSMMYGTSNTNDAAVALLEEPPTDLPPRLQVGHILLGRYIFVKSAGVALQVDDVWGTTLSPGGGGDGDVRGPAGGVVADEVTVYADTGGKAIAGSGGLLSANLAVLDATRTFSKVVQSQGTDDSTVVLSLANTGTNPGQADTLVGDRNPEGLITAEPGTKYKRQDGVNSTEYILKSAATANTPWIEVGSDGGGSIVLPLGFRRRSTSPTITSTQNFFDFDVDVETIDASFFTFASGTFTAQKTFTCNVEVELSVSLGSGDARVHIDIVKNTSTLIGEAVAMVDGFDVDRQDLSAQAVSDFVSTDTLRVFLYRESGQNPAVVGGTLTICVTPLETL